MSKAERDRRVGEFNSAVVAFGVLCESLAREADKDLDKPWSRFFTSVSIRARNMHAECMLEAEECDKVRDRELSEG